MSDQPINTPAPETPPDVQLEHEQILEDYRRRQMVEHLTGPMISLLLHVLVIVACAVLLVGKEVREASAFEFNTRELEVKPLDPEILEELDTLQDEMVDDMVPTVEKPVVQAESVSVEATKDFAEAVAASEMDFDVNAMLDVKVTRSPIKLPGMWSNRTGDNREKARREFAGRGGDATERAVLKALRWLKEHQSPDGSWAPVHKDAMTGLGLLAFLAHGETPDPASSPEFAMTVQKACQWLANYMLARNAPEGGGRGYSHGMATYALCEAYGMTKLPFLKPAMENGLSIIINGQQPGGGYDYNFAKGERWDLSVSAWQFQAMKAGYVAGANVPGLEEAIEKAVKFVRDTTYANGRFGYSSPGSGSWGMCGAGALTLQLMGEGKSVEAQAGVRSLAEGYTPVWDDEATYASSSHPSYAWYYVTQAMFHGGKSVFSEWNKVFAPMLVRNQKPDGHWECPGAKNDIGPMDPYYATTLNCLSLQVYYRYLPTYKTPTAVASSDGDVFDLDGAIDKGL